MTIREKILALERYGEGDDDDFTRGETCGYNDALESAADIAEEEIERLGKMVLELEAKYAKVPNDNILAAQCEQEADDEIIKLKGKYKSEIEQLKKTLRKRETSLFKYGAMLDAPCFSCGYNGPSYFNPEVHKCAKKHHALYREFTEEDF